MGRFRGTTLQKSRVKIFSKQPSPIRGYYAKAKFVQVDTLFLSRHKSIFGATHCILMRFFACILTIIVSPCSPNFIIFLKEELFFLFFPYPDMHKIGKNGKMYLENEFWPNFLQPTIQHYKQLPHQNSFSLAIVQNFTKTDLVVAHH